MCEANKERPQGALCLSKVPRRGLEPPRLAAHPPQGCLATNYNTWAGVPCGFSHYTKSIAKKKGPVIQTGPFSYQIYAAFSSAAGSSGVTS